MNRGMLRSLLFVSVLAGVTMLAGQANAGWRHWGFPCGVPYVGWTGYSYSYYGGWDCCGPTYSACYAPVCTTWNPCWAPSCRGCGLLGRLAYRWRAHHYGYYWGCSSPCYVTSCCDICGCGWDDCGCGGTVIEESYPSSQPMEGPTPADPTPADPATPEQTTSMLRGGALLTVQVPDNARILVNGIPTRSQGDLRRYISRNLTPGFDYTYEVKAEAMVNGVPVTETKTVQLRAGQQAQLAFDFQTPSAVETALTLHVPAEAKVYLAGQATKGEGSVRTFRTAKLPAGQTWADYVVRVVVDENGEQQVKEETITLRAGEQRQMTFDFEVDKLASAR